MERVDVEMVNILSLFVLAIAVSVDSFMVAFGYGLRQVKLAPHVIILIGLCSGLVFGMAMGAGQLVALLLTERFTSYLGAILLIGLGCYSLLTFDQSQSQTKPKHFRFEFKKVGLVIDILKKPAIADLDHSGHISGMETVWLGLALSIDASAAGMGAALVGVSYIAIGLIAITTMVFLSMGLHLGVTFSNKGLPDKIRYLPGLLLVLLGISRLVI